MSTHPDDGDAKKIIIIIVTSFAPISSKIKLSGATKPGD